MFQDMASSGLYKHWCKICNKKFLSGRALGGHMACHRNGCKQPKSTHSPPGIDVDLHVSLLGPCDEKPSLLPLEIQCMHCSKEFSTWQSLRGHMRIHNEKQVSTNPDEELVKLMEDSVNANGDHGHNAMLFSPVKRKRSKRGMPMTNSEEMCAAVTLLMLGEHPDRTSACEDFCGGDKDDNSLTPNLLKEVNLNAEPHVQPDDFMSNITPKSDKNSAYGDFYEHSEENNLSPDADVPKKEVLPFHHGLDVGAEFMKPRADISVEESKPRDLSDTVKVSRHQCKVCGKVLRSGKALGGHMRLHYVGKCNLRQGAADCPNFAMMVKAYAEA